MNILKDRYSLISLVLIGIFLMLSCQKRGITIEMLEDSPTTDVQRPKELVIELDVEGLYFGLEKQIDSEKVLQLVQIQVDKGGKTKILVWDNDDKVDKLVEKLEKLSEENLMAILTIMKEQKNHTDAYLPLHIQNPKYKKKVREAFIKQGLDKEFPHALGN